MCLYGWKAQRERIGFIIFRIQQTVFCISSKPGIFGTVAIKMCNPILSKKFKHSSAIYRRRKAVAKLNLSKRKWPLFPESIGHWWRDDVRPQSTTATLNTTLATWWCHTAQNLIYVHASINANDEYQCHRPREKTNWWGPQHRGVRAREGMKDGRGKNAFVCRKILIPSRWPHKKINISYPTEKYLTNILSGRGSVILANIFISQKNCVANAKKWKQMTSLLQNQSKVKMFNKTVTQSFTSSFGYTTGINQGNIFAKGWLLYCLCIC